MVSLKTKNVVRNHKSSSKSLGLMEERKGQPRTSNHGSHLGAERLVCIFIFFLESHGNQNLDIRSSSH